MANNKQEFLQEIRKRLKVSDRRKWETLTDEEKDLAVDTYYNLRNTDFQNINFLLREHAAEKKEFFFLVLGIAMGVFANPISTILLKHLPSETIWQDMLTGSFFALLLVWTTVLFMRMSAESLGEEKVIERLLEIGKQIAPRDSE